MARKAIIRDAITANVAVAKFLREEATAQLLAATEIEDAEQRKAKADAARNMMSIAAQVETATDALDQL